MALSALSRRQRASPPAPYSALIAGTPPPSLPLTPALPSTNRGAEVDGRDQGLGPSLRRGGTSGLRGLAVAVAGRSLACAPGGAPEGWRGHGDGDWADRGRGGPERRALSTESLTHSGIPVGPARPACRAAWPTAAGVDGQYSVGVAACFDEGDGDRWVGMGRTGAAASQPVRSRQRGLLRGMALG